ncbi:TPA: hypothetical protein DCE37_25665 [Candidatus Latescibacteria bacterium]|nr:hypothetical protein [Candidatus Latescibacterota bacterium]
MTDQVLGSFDGIWIAPSSPFRDLHGAIRAITFSRTRQVPRFGTCAGFQHAVLERAHNVLDFDHAQSAEYDPTASRLFVSALTCSLAPGWKYRSAS